MSMIPTSSSTAMTTTRTTANPISRNDGTSPKPASPPLPTATSPAISDERSDTCHDKDNATTRALPQAGGIASTRPAVANGVIGNGVNVVTNSKNEGANVLQAFPALGSLLAGANVIAQQPAFHQQVELIRQLAMLQQTQPSLEPQQQQKQQQLIQQVVQQQQQLAAQQQQQQEQSRLLEAITKIGDVSVNGNVNVLEISKLIVQMMIQQQDQHQRQQQQMESIRRMLSYKVQSEACSIPTLSGPGSFGPGGDTDLSAASRLELLCGLISSAVLPNMCLTSTINTANTGDASTSSMQAGTSTSKPALARSLGQNESSGSTNVVKNASQRSFPKVEGTGKQGHDSATTTKVPCRARGQPREHNHKVCACTL